MNQVHTGAYVSLLAPEKSDDTGCHPGKTTTYILHVGAIIRIRTSDSSQMEKTNKEKKIKERGKEGKETKRKKRKRKGAKRRDKTRRGSKEWKRGKT